ncbi:hypothetical protein GCM10010503_01300 [Streptomyces lucensis JCM 4490]|uniref:Uncharacterized protein n=1 Tax=Streptomyces lucensis JCM 4490 TaxID=1306176 RepID=A0A918MIK5_9ACTN|nr:hypothetical protein GCM10010503_01300 [Streptomyces lucensis JCM 4490]
MPLQSMRGSPARMWLPPVCKAFMVVVPSQGVTPKDTGCQMPWLVRKVGRCDTPWSDEVVTVG